MSYITINTDVTIDYDDISSNDLMDIIEYKLDLYKRKKDQSYYKDFRKAILECLKYDTAGESVEEDHILSFEGTVQDWLKDKTLNELKTKYTLEELETFLHKA